MITLLLDIALISIVIAAGCFILIIYDYYIWKAKEQGADLLIKVIDREGRKLKVSPGMLEGLLARNEISRFRRANGWVKIGWDSIRSRNNNEYVGQDRRWA